MGYEVPDSLQSSSNSSSDAKELQAKVPWGEQHVLSSQYSESHSHLMLLIIHLVSGDYALVLVPIDASKGMATRR